MGAWILTVVVEIAIVAVGLWFYFDQHRKQTQMRFENRPFGMGIGPWQSETRSGQRGPDEFREGIKRAS